MISEELISKVNELNEKFKERNNNSNLSRDRVRSLINNVEGQKIQTFTKMSEEELKAFKGQKHICVVDGSVNRVGANYPNYVEFFQAMAMLNSKDKPIVKTDVVCPLIDGFDEMDELNQSKRTLCLTEIAAAYDAVKNHDVKALLMDGTLVRYHIQASDEFEKLVNLCREKQVVLIGVVEEINTKIIMEAYEAEDEPIGMLFDREALFNAFDMNEGFIVKKYKSWKAKIGIEQAFVRTSKDPCVIAIDIMDYNLDIFNSIISFVLALCDENTRGVPFLLDIVDKKTRIENGKVKTLASKYLDTEIFQAIFRSQRSKRVI